GRLRHHRDGLPYRNFRTRLRDPWSDAEERRRRLTDTVHPLDARTRGSVTAVDTPARHIARWDLDKTYLRTEFDTLRDLVKTAFERPDEKRTNPGAATLLRELSPAGVSIYILSGSPEQMRGRLEEKLKLDGIKWDGFTL